MNIILYFKKLNIGGAERSTVRLLNELHNAGHAVTLFVNTKGGALESELSPCIKIKYFYKDTGVLKDWDRTRKGFFKIGLVNIISAAFQYCVGCLRKLFFRLYRPMYDLAITGWHGYEPYVLKKYTRYKKHYQMIRNENAIAVNGRSQPFIKRYKENLDIVDGYICVSEYLREMMIKVCDIPEKSVVTIYNIINIDTNYFKVNSCPTEYAPYWGREIIIATICRLVDGPKGLFRMVRVCSKLKELGYRFKWLIIGDGVDKARLIDAINEADLTEIMILCGFKQNPVPYYRFADIIAVLSYVEGLCGTVNEAKLLKKPLIATRFSSIEEQIIQDVNGLIVENNDDAILEGMIKLLSDPSYRNSLAVNKLPNRLIDNTYKVKQFEKLVV